MIRESEDLLELEGIKLRGQEYAVKILRIKKGNPRIDSFRSGDFFCDKVIMNHANIIRALHFINKNFHRPLSLEEVSRESGMSRYHFARTFKAVPETEKLVLNGDLPPTAAVTRLISIFEGKE